ncbi:MAG: monofunctional biosynthetic peptidoglycan transglycosylase [Bauldia sp.]|nr:monofunctional biosynthetic peptidoglycan transglycosylase [Bauldia sp.]
MVRVAAKARSAGKKGAAARPAPALRRRWLRRILIGLAALALLPVVLVPAYRFVPPVSALMVYTRIAGGPIARDWVAFGDISPTLVASVLMSEDGRFCEHWGVDWGALGDVIDDPGGPSRGASTIAMQTVRNLFLWQSRSYVRKGLEIPLALYADAVWGKRRTMEIYLNIAEWGPQIFGIEAAARHYFGRSARDLSARQAALLAAALPNPIGRNPAKPSRTMQSRARTIEARARASGAYVGCLFE